MKFARSLAASALTVALASTATLTGATVAIGATAQAPAATSAVITDKVGDVELRKDGWNKGMDIIRVRYAKSGSNLKTVIKVRDLNDVTIDPYVTYYSITIEIAGQTEYAYGDQPGVAPSVYRADDAKHIDCPAAKTVLAVAKDLVRITVPLSCFENPTRVGVEANSVQFSKDNPDRLLARDHSDPSKVINVS